MFGGARLVYLWDSRSNHLVFGVMIILVILDATGVIHTEVRESLGALEERELEEAIALSLATSSIASDDSPRPSVAPTKAPPPTLAQHSSFLQVPVLERPAMLPFGVPPPELAPSPPVRPPTPAQRAAANRRLASLPVFPPHWLGLDAIPARSRKGSSAGAAALCYTSDSGSRTVVLFSLDEYW